MKSANQRRPFPASLDMKKAILSRVQFEALISDAVLQSVCRLLISLYTY